jgi:hypothetical protein
MKTRILFWGAVLFLVLGLNTKDGTLFLHKISFTPQSDVTTEPLSEAEPARK